MKRKEFDKFKQKSINEIEKEIKDKKQALVKLKLEHKIGRVKNSRNMKMLKRDIAQLLTILQEKKSEQNYQSSQKIRS